MNRPRHGIARVRVGNLPRPKAAPPLAISATSAAQANIPAVTPSQAVAKLQAHGNQVFTRWLTTPGTIRLDGHGESAADALADRLRTGHAAVRNWQAPAIARSGGILKPRIEAMVRSVISTRGSPLPAPFRARAEAHAGETLDEIEIHTDSRAAEAADALNARAFAFGPHLVFAAGEYVPNSRDGEGLLAHEVAHALLQKSVGASVVQRWDREHPSPFEPLLAEFESNIRVLEAFITELEEVTQQSTEFARELRNLHTALDDINNERTATSYLSDEAGSPLVRSRGGGTEERPPSPVPEGSGVIQGVYDEVRTMYYGPTGVVTRSPSTRHITDRRAQLQRGTLLIQTVRVAVLNLVNSVPMDASVAQRDVTLDVASYYMQCGTIREPEAVAQLGFLQAFYADPSVIMLYAAVREGEYALRDIIPNERIIQEHRTQVSQASTASDSTLARYLDEAVRLREQMQALIERHGTAPRRPEAAREMPTIGSAMLVGAYLRYFAVAQSTLSLWVTAKYLQNLMMSSDYAGTSLIPGATDRDRWIAEFRSLLDAFLAEMREADRPRAGFEDRIAGFEPRVRRLSEEIPAAVRNREIMASIAEQIPFLFVGGGVAGGVGRFVSGLTRGSRWLIAIAEGVTLTAMTALASPASMRPTSVTGWATMLVLNIGWARVGRALFEFGGDVARGMSSTRGAIARASVEIVIPTASMAALQTGVQLIEAHAAGAGGETNVTEALTINLVMNALGVMCGAAMNGHLVSDRRPTASELARSAHIDEAAAQRWLAMAERSVAFGDEMLRLQEMARRGTLTPEEFEAMKARGRALADDMEATLPDLAETLGLGRTPGEIRAGINSFRARLAALTYSPRPTVTGLLPEYTGGITRVNATTFVYDAAHPPARLAELRAALAERYTVRERPGGGFEATTPEGRIVALVLPAGRGTVVLPPSMDVLARGPQAEAGLARVRAQTAAPLLEPLLARAGGLNAAATVRLLQVVGRTIETGDTLAWQGLANYLNNGGDIACIARAISHHASTSEALAAQGRAQTILRQVATWDASAVRGLGVLYRARARTTGEQLLSLFEYTNFEPEQTRGIFQSLDRLEPISRHLGRVIGPLASGNLAQQRGAMGMLTTAVHLADQFPDHIIAFETPVYDESGRIIRVQDINVILPGESTAEAIVPESTVYTYEVKEISVATLGRRGPHQFAIDMLLDSRQRARVLAEGGTPRPVFDSFRWRIRRMELAERAGRSPSVTAGDAGSLDAQMRRLVEGMLERGFTDPALNSLTAEERAAYRAAFAGVPFVEFF